MKNLDELKQYIKNHCLKYHISTYGCKMNEHESEKLAGILESLGYIDTTCQENADFIVFNTCCVRENAEDKTFGNVGALKGRKKSNEHLMICVCGCMMQQQEAAQKLADMFPFVDIVFGTHNVHKLADMILQRVRDQKRVMNVWQTEGEIHENTPVKRQNAFSADVNIMYGCNNFCSYCIVPYVRGRERSRDSKTIVSEIHSLYDEGFSEITLLGQNVNSYDAGDCMRFAQLLQKICKDTKIPRIRFMTSHPKDLSDELIDVIAANPQICKHIHLPVQSGSSHILKLMNRKYTREAYIDLVQKIRKAIPSIAITTDIIVGFPGESDADFEDTMSLVDEIQFDSAYTFVYSKRNGTAAARMTDFVEESVQRERIMRLISLQNRITEQCNQKYEGKIEKILVESVSIKNKNHLFGRTQSSKIVNFEGDVSLIGKFCDVKITQGKRSTLFGELKNYGE
ncbi:MAG: tRNA (N6-isopentenyl adenosine(37)-C2)-methylthiotransferase MiaB [Christensenellaceae bacterium]